MLNKDLKGKQRRLIILPLPWLAVVFCFAVLYSLKSVAKPIKCSTLADVGTEIEYEKGSITKKEYDKKIAESKKQDDSLTIIGNSITLKSWNISNSSIILKVLNNSRSPIDAVEVFVTVTNKFDEKILSEQVRTQETMYPGMISTMNIPLGSNSGIKASQINLDFAINRFVTIGKTHAWCN